MYPIIVDLETAAWAAQGSSTVRFHRVPPQIAGAMSHISAMNFKLVVTITADAANDTEGDEIIRAINEIRIIDRFGIVAVRLRGHMLRTVLKCATGRLGGGIFADPANIAAGAGAGQVRVCYFRVPWHGGHGGLIGVRGYADVLQPVDRFSEGRIEVDWGTATPFQDADHGTITAAVLYPSVELDVRREIIQGMDVRWRYGDWGDAQQIMVDLQGEALHSLLVCNPDLDHDDYTVVTLQELGRAINVNPDHLIMSWNACCALGNAEYENPFVDPEFVPVVFPRWEGKLLGAVPFRRGQVELQLTNTNATDQEIGIVELFNTNLLARRMATVPQTLTYGRNVVRLKTGKKGKMQGHKYQRMGALGPVKMMSTSEANR